MRLIPYIRNTEKSQKDKEITIQFTFHSFFEPTGEHYFQPSNILLHITFTISKYKEKVSTSCMYKEKYLKKENI